MQTQVGRYKYFSLLTIVLAVIQRRIHPDRIGAISHSPKGEDSSRAYGVG